MRPHVESDGSAIERDRETFVNERIAGCSTLPGACERPPIQTKRQAIPIGVLVELWWARREEVRQLRVALSFGVLRQPSAISRGS